MSVYAFALSSLFPKTLAARITSFIVSTALPVLSAVPRKWEVLSNAG